jgi:hypothetical protein
MSTVQSTAQARPLSRLHIPRTLVALAVVVALAAAALTAVLVASGGSDAAAPQRSAHAASLRQHFGGRAEGPGVRSESRSGAANDGTDHAGARP